eukprot:3932744-Rhodomonas_salina.1
MRTQVRDCEQQQSQAKADWEPARDSVAGIDRSAFTAAIANTRRRATSSTLSVAELEALSSALLAAAGRRGRGCGARSSAVPCLRAPPAVSPGPSSSPALAATAPHSPSPSGQTHLDLMHSRRSSAAYHHVQSLSLRLDVSWHPRFCVLANIRWLPRCGGAVP